MARFAGIDIDQSGLELVSGLHKGSISDEGRGSSPRRPARERNNTGPHISVHVVIRRVTEPELYAALLPYGYRDRTARLRALALFALGCSTVATSCPAIEPPERIRSQVVTSADDAERFNLDLWVRPGREPAMFAAIERMNARHRACRVRVLAALGLGMLRGIGGVPVLSSPGEASAAFAGAMVEVGTQEVPVRQPDRPPKSSALRAMEF